MHHVYKHRVADVCRPAGYRVTRVAERKHDCRWRIGITVTVNCHLGVSALPSSSYFLLVQQF